MVRTYDKSYIRSIFGSEDVYPFIADDFTPRPQDINPVLNDHVVYLRPFEGGAVFMLHPQNSVLWSCHVAVLKDHRDRSTRYSKAAIEWVRKNTRCRCLMALLATDNIPVIRLVDVLGFKKSGVIAKSIQVNGVLRDQLLYVLEM